MYFEKPGNDNTEKVLRLAFEKGKELGINEVVVASTTGKTAFKAMDVFQGYQLTVVTYHCGFKEPFKNTMSDDVKQEIEGKGIKVVTASHALSGLERSVAKKHSGAYPVLIIADTLRLLGQGIKVAVEVAVMASDAGALSGNDIISIGGSGRGADAARGAHAARDPARGRRARPPR